MKAFAAASHSCPATAATADAFSPGCFARTLAKEALQ